MKLEEKMLSRNIKGIEKGLEIYGFGIVKYSIRSESRRMIMLRAQKYYVPGLPKDLHIISPQNMCTPEGYKSTFIAHCNDNHGSYAEINMKEDKPGCQKAKPVERVYINYEPKNNLPTHEDIIPNHIQKEFKALSIDVYVTNEANQNLTPSQKELL